MTESARARTRATSLEELGALFERLAQRDLAKASIAEFEPRASDVIITPFGKSGTTWTQQIFHTLRSRGDMDFDDISRVVPWIETSGHLGIDANAEQAWEPRGFKSHLAWDKMPQGATYINVIRDPVDAAFSLFKFMEGWYIEPGTIAADEFVTVAAAASGYEKHFVSWWPRRNDDDVLYLVFEHMKRDTEATVEKIADFIGVELDDELRALTLEHSSLAFMQQHKDRFDDAMMRARSEETELPSGSDSAKVREGKVGAHGLADETVAAIQARWQEQVAPVTGYASYQELIDALT